MSLSLNKTKIFGATFALMPLLGIYSIGIPFLSLGQVLLVVLVVISLVSGEKIRTPIFMSFTLYAVIITLLNILAISGIIIGDEIHDVLAWLFFMITVLGAISFANYQTFCKVFVVFGWVCVGFFYIQFVLSLVGVRISGLLPFLPLASNVDFQTMVEKQVSATRLSSLFMEPAHYAENMSLFLALVLMKASNMKKALLSGSIITVSIFLSQSAMGVVLVLFVWLWWFIKRYRFNISSIIILAVLLGMAIPFLLSSEITDQLLLRFSADYVSGASGEGHFSTYIRTVRGYIPFIESGFIHKLFGCGLGALSSFIKMHPGTGFLAITDLIPNWINGMSYLLLSTGILGTFLYIKVCIKLFKNNSELGKAVMILVFLLLLSSDSLFLIYHYFFIAIMEKFKNRRENSAYTWLKAVKYLLKYDNSKSN